MSRELIRKEIITEMDISYSKNKKLNKVKTKKMLYKAKI